MYVFVNSPPQAPRDCGARLRLPVGVGGDATIVHGRLMGAADTMLWQTAKEVYTLAFRPPMFKFPTRQAGYEFDLRNLRVGEDFVVEFRRRGDADRPKRRGRTEWDRLRGSELTRQYVVGRPSSGCLPRIWTVDMLYNDNRECAGSVVMPEDVLYHSHVLSLKLGPAYVGQGCIVGRTST